jgi:Putative RNA methylase family UPF0020
MPWGVDHATLHCGSRRRRTVEMRSARAADSSDNEGLIAPRSKNMHTDSGLEVRRHAIKAETVVCNWGGSASTDENTFHQLAPYIGKLKSSMAASLVSQFSNPGELLYDPFSGSGTVALEGWAAGRQVVANDLSPYAALLTRAKLFPCRSLEDALCEIERSSSEAVALQDEVNLPEVPRWVREFFHPKTLREVISWTSVLRRRRRWFLLASLMGILHHQRPGFLSFPASHTIPYLRIKKFPRSRFPELYRYRSLRGRLEAKVNRAFRRVPPLDFSISRSCYSKAADLLVPPERVDAIITSPPYMRQLDYGRDNRLRLWFLGSHDWSSLDRSVSPCEDAFLELMRRCFSKWKTVLKPHHCCTLIIGDACSRAHRENLPEVVSRIATEEVGEYSRVCEYTESIPNERRVRRGIIGSGSETIVVLRYAPSRPR